MMPSGFLNNARVAGNEPGCFWENPEVALTWVRGFCNGIGKSGSIQ